MANWNRFLDWLRPDWFRRADEPRNLRRGRLGERAAERHLRRAGYRILAANFRGRHGEIDLVARDGDSLVFVEVKTRSREDWSRPADAVDAKKRRRISRTALEYLNRVGNPRVHFRFDIVEVLLDPDRVREVRHLQDAFPLDRRHRYL